MLRIADRVMRIGHPPTRIRHYSDGLFSPWRFCAKPFVPLTRHKRRLRVRLRLLRKKPQNKARWPERAGYLEELSMLTR